MTGSSVVVAVLTYRRPDDLAQVLPLLDAQRGRRAAQILVVDNDPEASGRATWQAAGVPDCRYVHEPTPGIAAARNRALREAEVHDVLVFVDDDERPATGWLDLMLGTFETHEVGGRRPVGVVGPVVSQYAGQLEPWVAAGRFFDRRRMPTGTEVSVAATNNLLLDLHQVRRAGIAFDERFGLSGGSDTLFTRQLVRAAGPMVWCDEAVVTDVVPAERCTRDWVLRRALRSGNSWSRTALALDASMAARLGTRARLSLDAAVRTLGGTGRLATGVVTRDLGRRARGTRTIARGVGMLLGAYGYTYVEYRRPARSTSDAPVTA